MHTPEDIKNAGLKMTPQRRIIYEAMIHLQHGTIDDILTYLKEYGIDMTISTVYRILNSFCEVHLLTTVIHPTTGKTLYDINNHPHHHVFRKDHISDVTDPELTSIIIEHLKRKNISPDDIKQIQLQITLND